MTFVDFDSREQRVQKSGYRYVRYILYPEMKLKVSSTFYLRLLFSGNYDQGCGFTFDIMDKTGSGESIYHLDLRFNTKNRYRKVIQNDKFDGDWGREKVADIPDLVKENDIFVSFTDKHIEVTINNIEITEKFQVNLSRLSSFKYLNIVIYGSCIQLDRASSYMSNRG